MGAGEAAPRSPEPASRTEPARVLPEEAAGLARPPRAGHRLLVLGLLLAGSLAAAVEDHAGWRLAGVLDEQPPPWTHVARWAGDWGPYLGLVAVLLTGLLRARRQERRWLRRRPALAARTFGRAPTLRDALGATLLLVLVPVADAALKPHLSELDQAVAPWPMLQARQPASSVLSLVLMGTVTGLLVGLWLRGGPTVVTDEHAVSASPFGLGATLVPLGRCRVTAGPTSVTLVRDLRLPLRLEVGDGLERLVHALGDSRPPGPSVESPRRLAIVVAVPPVLVVAVLQGSQAALALSRLSAVGLVVAPLSVAAAWALLRRAGAGAAPVDVGAGALVVDEQLVPWSLRPRVALERGWLAVEARRTRAAAYVGARAAALEPALVAGLAPGTLARTLPGWVLARQARATALLGGAVLALLLLAWFQVVPDRAKAWNVGPHGTLVDVSGGVDGLTRLRLVVDPRAVDGALLPVVVDPSGRWVERGGERFDLPPWATLGLLDRDGIAFEVGPAVRRTIARSGWAAGPTGIAADDDRPLARVIRTGERGLACFRLSATRSDELGLCARIDRGALTFVGVLQRGFRWPKGEGCEVCRLAALHPGRALRAVWSSATTGPLPTTAAALAAIDRVEAGTAPVASVGPALLPNLFPDRPRPR